jgi:hypothetical protein
LVSHDNDCGDFPETDTACRAETVCSVTYPIGEPRTTPLFDDFDRRRLLAGSQHRHMVTHAIRPAAHKRLDPV